MTNKPNESVISGFSGIKNLPPIISFALSLPGVHNFCGFNPQKYIPIISSPGCSVDVCHKSVFQSMKIQNPRYHPDQLSSPFQFFLFYFPNILVPKIKTCKRDTSRAEFMSQKYAPVPIAESPEVINAG